MHLAFALSIEIISDNPVVVTRLKTLNIEMSHTKLICVYRCETQTLTIGYNFSAGLSKLNLIKNFRFNSIAIFLTKRVVSFEIIWKNE